MINRLTRIHVSSFLLAVLSAGCGKALPPIVPVEGVVILEGKPLPNVEVRLIPMIDRGAECIARGVTDRDGRFILTCRGQPGAYACENHVLVREAEIPAHLKSENAQAALATYLQGLAGRPLPEQYASLADNPLTIHVTADKQEYQIKLLR